ncbi:MAG: NUDIX domain-containing protein [Clostridiaceae bacterium]|nr:NUDIX domain-containing protein [Eubacteriales bacterium]
MEKLLMIDAKDYTGDMPVFEKNAVRALILKGGLVAMQISKYGDYKIPGGTVEAGESYAQALVREVREETGLIVDPSTIAEIGEIEEIRQDQFFKGQKYICHSLYYKCEVLPETVETDRTDNEIGKGYQLEWNTMRNIYDKNMRLQKEPWSIRDTKFLELILNDIVRL